jgi:hypothetical protein
MDLQLVPPRGSLAGAIAHRASRVAIGLAAYGIYIDDT